MDKRRIVISVAPPHAISSLCAKQNDTGQFLCRSPRKLMYSEPLLSIGLAPVHSVNDKTVREEKVVHTVGAPSIDGLLGWVGGR